MGEVFLWGPILWTLRVVALLVLVAGAYLGVLHFLRYLRWRHIKAIAGGAPPRLKELELLGQKVVFLDVEQDDLREFTKILEGRVRAVETRLLEGDADE